jgi:hypothetical protein
MITREKFQAYESLRELGTINMLDVKAGTELTGLSKDDYYEIITNYKKYKENFK